MLRKNKNVTQKEVANALNIPRGTYAHYELGKRSPDHSMLLNLAEYFNVSTDYLLGRADDITLGNKCPKEDTPYNIIAQIEQTLQAVLLSDDTKEIIKMLIKNDPYVKPVDKKKK